MSGEIIEIVFDGVSHKIKPDEAISRFLFPHAQLALEVGDAMTIEDPKTGIKCRQKIAAIDLENRIIRFEGVVHEVKVDFKWSL